MIAKKLQIIYKKTCWYLLSMWLFALIVLILTINIPIYFGTDAEFIGLKELWDINGILPILSILILLITGCFWFDVLYRWKGAKELSVPVKELEERHGDSLAFLASYFIPLVSFQVNNGRHQIVLILLFVAIGVMYVKGNLFHQNPTLLLLGFKLYTIKSNTENGSEEKICLITKDTLTRDSKIQYRIISNNVWLCRKLPVKKT